jgi:hypothetical protein
LLLPTAVVSNVTQGTKESGEDLKEGTKVSVKYTEKAGEKTAVGVKDIGKNVAK